MYDYQIKDINVENLKREFLSVNINMKIINIRKKFKLKIY